MLQYLKNIISPEVLNDRYEVVRKLGEGDESEVFLVKDTNESNLEYKFRVLF
jgi:hypothetical protein